MSIATDLKVLSMSGIRHKKRFRQVRILCFYFYKWFSGGEDHTVPPSAIL